MKLNNHTHRHWFSLVILVLLMFSLSSVSNAAPRKILDARWVQNWVHPGATTTISSDRRTLTTKLPKPGSINSNYLGYISVNMNMGGESLPVYITAKTHQGMINCPTKKPHPKKPVLQVYCTALTSTGSDGMRNLTKDTKITIKITTPGGGYRELYWKFQPKPAPLPVSCNYKFGFWHPGNNQHFAKGTKVSVKAQLKQGTSVLYMDLYLNNQLISRDRNYPYEWGHRVNDFKLRSLQPGTYTLKIKAKDNCGNTKEKSRVFYIDAAQTNNGGGNNNSCNNNFTFYRPNGTNYPAGTDLYVRASPQQYQVTEWMKLYVNNQFIREENSHPYEWGKPNSNSDAVLRNMQPGTYVLRVDAKSNCETLLQTRSKTIYIQN